MTRYSNPFGAFEIDSMPGQSQVAICHSFIVPEDLRGQGYAHQLKSLQEIELDIKHYDLAICTVSANNTRQKRVLSKAGWTYLTSFRNRRSSETTELWRRGGQPEETSCANSSKPLSLPLSLPSAAMSPAAATRSKASASEPTNTSLNPNTGA